jgi:uncharacterized protein (DUF885 family)
MTTRRRLLWLLGAGAVSWRAGARDEAAGERCADPNARFERHFNEPFFDQYWVRNTEQAVASGYYRVAGSLNVPDALYRADYQRFLEHWLAQLRSVPLTQLNDRNRTDWAVLDSRLRYEQWALTTLREWQWNPAIYNIAEPLALILDTEYAPLDQRLRTASARLADVPAYYAAASRALLRPTREHTALAIDQNRGALQLLGTGLEQQIAGSGITPKERARLATQIKAARAAVQTYIDALQALTTGPAALAARSFRIGQALYGQKFLFVHQSGESAPSLYRRALSEKELVLARMDELSTQLWSQYFPDSATPVDRYERIGRVIAKLSENHVAPADYVPAVERLIPALADWVESHRLIDLDPSKPLQVRETPSYERGVAIAGIDAPGPYDPAARTYFNVDPLDQDTLEQAESFLREYNNWMLPVFIAHETIPGHYVQLMYANRSPSRIKSIFGNGAMIEGWAVYSERMMLESGYGGNASEQWLMYWKWYLRSVTNTILDYSVHVLGMSEAVAKDLLRHEAFQSEKEVAGKWIRVQRSSVQLTQYYSGFSAIYRLRERVQHAQGDRFDLRAFHEQFLSYGSAPVAVIAALMSPGASSP